MILHVHIPKTGGTSLREALSTRYKVWRPRGRVAPDGVHEGAVEVLRRRAENPALRRRARAEEVITGHIPLAVRDFLDRPRCLTILRDPVERSLSHYFGHVREAQWLAGHAPRFDATPAAVDNLQTRYLCGGLRVFRGPATRAMLDAAIENLETVEYGLTENLGEFFARLGLPPQERRRLTWRPRREEIPGPLRDAAQEANELDQELYDHARR